jgi:GDP-4-dehydro-6-deoxy-D-mannose reductase
MRALIIGGAGFVGGHLINHLLSLTWEIFATRLPNETIDAPVSVHELDILDDNAVNALFAEIKPDCVFHLAAQSSVALSWTKPAMTADINIKGTINILEAARRIRSGCA